jgi:hypothetical protein
LLEDQVLYGLADEVARLRVGNDGITHFRRSLRPARRALPATLAYRLLVDPLAVFRNAGTAGRGGAIPCSAMRF